MPSVEITNISISNLTSNSSSETDAVISTVDYVGYVFVPLLFVVGVVGNSLTIRVMLSKSLRGLAISKLLIALSLSDTLVNLLFPFNKPFVRMLLGTDIRALSPGGCKLFFWAYRYAKITSSWMVVLISCERFVAVWFHVKAKSINTPRNAYIAMAVVYGSIAAYIGYWCSVADQIIDGNCIPNTQPAGLEYLTEILLVIGLCMYAYIPAVLLLLLNGLIIYKLVTIRRRRNVQVAPVQAPANKGATSNTTVMLLGVSVAFVVLVTPNATSHLVSFARKQNIFQTRDPAMVFLREVSQVMEQLNHSINFIMYVMCSKRFRARVVVLFRLNQAVVPASDVLDSATGPTPQAVTPATSIQMSTYHR